MARKAKESEDTIERGASGNLPAPRLKKVYQEQVMQIVHGLGGIKLRDAYSLIKNISKKKHDKIEKERPKFIEGSQKQGLTQSQAALLSRFAATL